MGASAVVGHGLRCPVACGIFPDQWSNLSSLNWQVDSWTVDHQGSPGLTHILNDKNFSNFAEIPKNNLFVKYLSRFLARTQFKDGIHCGCQAGRMGRGGLPWGFGSRRCKPFYREWISNKVLLYSTENYIQYPVTNHNGKEKIKIGIHSFSLLTMEMWVYVPLLPLNLGGLHVTAVWLLWPTDYRGMSCRFPSPDKKRFSISSVSFLKFCYYGRSQTILLERL